jgi:hypothetical protein
VESRFQEIVSSAQYALAIVGDASTGEFSLVPPLPAAMRDPDFLGVVAIVKGRPRSAFAKDLPDQMIDAIAQDMGRRIEVALCELERVVFQMPAN